MADENFEGRFKVVKLTHRIWQIIQKSLRNSKNIMQTFLSVACIVIHLAGISGDVHHLIILINGLILLRPYWMENKIEISRSLFENFAFYNKDTFSVEGAKPSQAESFQKQEIYIFDHLEKNCLKMMALCKERAAENKLRETFQIKDETNE